MNKSVSEILKDANGRHKLAERAKVLKDNDSEVLRGILAVTFHPQISWHLPPGAPPYKVNVEPECNDGLFREWAKMGPLLSVSHSPPLMPTLKREMLFKQILESVSEDDARLILSIKDKTFPYTSIDWSVIEKAFPGLVPEPPNAPGQVKKKKYKYYPKKKKALVDGQE